MSTGEPEDEQTRPDWVGQRAVAWVIDDAPVPAELAWTLTVIARRCNKHGKGSRQTTKTIAAKTGKSVKQAQREIVRLRELGLIVLGDQSTVEHIPPGQRPTVYDVPLHLKGAKPQKESRNKSGLRKDELPAGTPPLEGTPPLHGTPPLDAGGSPPLEGGSTPPLEGSQKKPLKKPLNNPSLSGDLPSVPAPRNPGDEERERDGSASPSTPDYQVLAEEGADRDEAATLIPIIVEVYEVRSPGFWRHVQRNRDIVAILARVRAIAAGTVQPGKMIAAGREVQPYGAEVNRQPRTSERGRLSAGARKFTDAHRLAAELDAEMGITPTRPDHLPEVTR